MDTNDLLRIARETIDQGPMCLAITVDQTGEANARVVQTSKLANEWTLRFMTDRRTRKVEEIERTGRLTLAYQDIPANSYVTLVGRAALVDDVTIKTAIWQPASYKWHPGGPMDPNVVLIEFTTDRIELWNSPHGVVPDPTKGLWAAALSRQQTGWRRHITSRRG